ncbi:MULTISPECIES: DUF6968 family protein [Corynebacterium]|jgi:hypothetical protein|uniref:DUF6968 family protein n=1 Tax=Corynebacterium TaxID=1716 RepID=UPI000831ABB6
MTAAEVPVVSRTLQRENGGAVRIRVWAPYSDGQDWFVRWSIHGLDSGEVEMVSGGVDSMQAMILALSAVGDRMGSEAGTFTFQQGPGSQLLHTVWNGIQDEWTAAVSMPTVPAGQITLPGTSTSEAGGRENGRGKVTGDSPDSPTAS